MLSDPTLLKSAAYVDGSWMKADDASGFTIRNPATGETLGTVPDLGAAETRRAIDIANAAWPAWRALAAKDRSALLRWLVRPDCRERG